MGKNKTKNFVPAGNCWNLPNLLNKRPLRIIYAAVMKRNVTRYSGHFYSLLGTLLAKVRNDRNGGGFFGLRRKILCHAMT